MSAPTSCRGETQEGKRCKNPPSEGWYCYLHCAGSRYISESTRGSVFDNCEGSCYYCGKQLTFANRSEGRGRWEPDHLKPHSQGGSNGANNLVAACYDCNRTRSDASVRDFGEGFRRCEGFKQNGTRCEYQVAPGNYKYCKLHQ